MILFRPGSHLDFLVTLLSIVGEYPVQSVSLLGNERVMKALIHDLALPQPFHNSITGEKFSGRVLSISGKSPNKTIRLCKSALPLLAWAGTDRYYLSAWGRQVFSGNRAHVERNHRVAETVAMFLRAGIECRPWRLPSLQLRQREAIIREPNVYLSKDLKQIEEGELNKTRYTRLTGALFSPGSCLATYNTRNAVMRWVGDGEFKTRHDLIRIGRLNANVNDVDSAVLFGRSYELALKTIEVSVPKGKPENRFDGVYRHIYFLTLNEFGIRQTALLTLPDWKEQILDLLFEPETRSYGNGSFEYDAYIDHTHVFSFLDSDIARLIRFAAAAEDSRRSCEVVCFPGQLDFLRSCLPAQTHYKTIELSALEDALGVKARCLLDR